MTVMCYTPQKPVPVTGAKGAETGAPGTEELSMQGGATAAVAAAAAAGAAVAAMAANQYTGTLKYS